MRKSLFVVLLCILETIVYPLQDDMLESFCEGEESIDLKCPEYKAIFIENITRNDVKCKITAHEDKCSAFLTNKLVNLCNARNRCMISPPFGFDENCPPRPKFVHIEYDCSCNKKETFIAEVCSNSIYDVHCHKDPFKCRFLDLIVNSKVQIVNAAEMDKTQCTNCTQEDIENSLIDLCESKQACIIPSTSEPCLYHRNHVTVKYKCLDNELTTSTDSSVETFKDMTISLDSEDRVLLSRTIVGTEERRTLCSFRWDDVDARVLCKFLNPSWMGVSKNVTRTSFETIPFAIHCVGDETSLLFCPYSEEQYQCQIDVVAGVICFTDMSTTAIVNNGFQEPLAKAHMTEITVGVSAGVVVLGCTITFVVYIAKRYKSAKNQSQKPEYENAVNFSLPSYPNGQDMYADLQARNATEHDYSVFPEENHTVDKTGYDYISIT